MITFYFENKEYKMMTEWEELSVNQYLNIMKVYQKDKVISLGEEMLCQQLIEVLTDSEFGTFDEITMELLLELMPKISSLSSTIDEFNNKTSKIPDYWIIDDIIYSHRKRYEDCTVGEITDIKTYIGDKQYIWEYLLDVASILIRPAKLQETPAGESYYKLEKRHPFDHEINKSRVGKLKFIEIKGYIDFFLSGWFKRMLITNDFTEVEAQKIVEDLKYLHPSEHLSYLTHLQKEI